MQVLRCSDTVLQIVGFVSSSAALQVYGYANLRDANPVGEIRNISGKNNVIC